VAGRHPAVRVGPARGQRHRLRLRHRRGPAGGRQPGQRHRLRVRRADHRRPQRRHDHRHHRPAVHPAAGGRPGRPHRRRRELLLRDLRPARHQRRPGMSSLEPESESGESGLVGVLVARDTGSTVVACGFLVDVFCLGVKNTNGPKTIDRRQAPGLHPDVLQRVVQQASRPGTAGTSPAYRVRSGGLRAKPGLRTPSRLRQGRRASRRLGGRQQRRHVRPGRKPFYINGPRDDTYGIMAKLRQAVGDGNFDYLVQFPGPAEVTLRN
jgi:hypothetical protein